MYPPDGGFTTKGIVQLKGVGAHFLPILERNVLRHPLVQFIYSHPEREIYILIRRIEAYALQQDRLGQN